MNHREEIYKNYIADTLFYKEENKRLTVRYKDIINPPEVADNADEIINELFEHAGLSFE